MKTRADVYSMLLYRGNVGKKEREIALESVQTEGRSLRRSRSFASKLTKWRKEDSSFKDRKDSKRASLCIYYAYIREGDSGGTRGEPGNQVFCVKLADMSEVIVTLNLGLVDFWYV